MDIIVLQGDGMVTLEIVGRLATLTSPELEKAVKPLVFPGAVVVFDCEKMEYISSSGLRVILSTHKQLASSGGRLVVRNLNPEVRSVFDMTGFLRLLNIE